MRVNTLRALLCSPAKLSRKAGAAILRSPWTWPAEEALVNEALALRVEGRARPLAGQSLLVEVHESCAELWLVSHGDPDTCEATTFDERTRRLAKSMSDRCYRVLPYAVRLPPAENYRLAPLSPSFPKVLTGDSFGGALWVATASFAMDVPARDDTAVLAACDGDGRLSRVDGLDLKLEAIVDGALAVTRVVVAPEQVNEALEALRRLAPPRQISIIGLAADDGLIRETFSEPLGEPASWEDGLSAALDEFRPVASPRTQVSSWAPVARGLAKLIARLPADGQIREEADRLCAIAERHDANKGRYELPADWRSRGRVLGLEWLSHAVQHAADSAPAQIASLLVEATAVLPPPLEADVMQLRVHGAVGRAEIVLGRWPEAAKRLGDVVRSWVQSTEFRAEAGRPLVAWLVVLGLAEDVAALDGALEIADSLRNPFGETDRAFVEVYGGRALVQAGSAERGLKRLRSAPARWAGAYTHVKAARARWEALACMALGDIGAVAAAREVALSFKDASGDLALVDAALEENEGVEDAIRRVSERDELVKWYCPNASVASARRLAWEYPY